ncbi:MAG: hypothetical protein E6J87_14955 [Deltaproteobacteria bacterium]|nr:MAG: hypothetical protein E6J87_14955 [Deltaproteobacteria bacterium]
MARWCSWCATATAPSAATCGWAAGDRARQLAARRRIGGRAAPRRRRCRRWARRGPRRAGRRGAADRRALAAVTLSDVSIRRPVLTWMMTLALIVFGVLGYERLGMDQFPSMDLPVLSVIATLEGADPEGMEEDVTDVLEEQLNTVAGVRSIESTTTSGATRIRVEFELGTDLDVAAQKVRDKIASVRRDLPKEMDPPVVSNHDFNEEPILWIPFNTTLPAVVASEYVRREIAPVFETIPGVVGVATFGRKDRQIRIWLRGDDLRARGLSANDVVAALGREHVEAPGGFVEGPQMEYGVKTDAEFRTLAELEQLVVSYRDGAPVLLSDVARMEDGAEDARSIHRYNGRETVGVGVRKQSGGNSVAIVDEVYKRLGAIKSTLPDGITLDEHAAFIDFTAEIREAVQETEFSLVFGAVLAVFTVFVFLRRARPTLIVATAIPISLIASFGLVWLSGYTLNTMTLLGMTLAVGVVIDDAIVVLENIERHREGGEDAVGAARAGTREIAFAASAATFSVAAVFVPVGIGADLAVRRAHTHTDARGAHEAARAARPRQHLPPARAGVRDHRGELSPRARLDARAPRAHDCDRADGVRRGARIRSRAPGRAVPVRRRGAVLREVRDRARHVARGVARIPRARRGVVPGAARGRGDVLVGRRGGTRPRRHDEPGHAVRAVARRARGTRRRPGPADPDLQPGRDDAGQLARGRDGDRAAREPAARGPRAVGRRDDRAAQRARRLRRSRPQPQAGPAGAARDPRPREGRRARHRRAHARRRGADHDRRAQGGRVQGGRPPLRHPRPARARRPQRPGRDRAPVCALARRRGHGAAQRGAHRARRGAVRDHAPRAAAQRHDQRESRRDPHGGGVQGRARDRRGPRASSRPGSRSGSACS